MIEGNLLCHLNFLRHTGDKFSCHRLICGLFRVGKSPEVLPLNALSVTHFDSRERILLQYEGVSGREAGALSIFSIIYLVGHLVPLLLLLPFHSAIWSTSLRAQPTPENYLAAAAAVVARTTICKYSRRNVQPSLERRELRGKMRFKSGSRVGEVLTLHVLERFYAIKGTST